MKKTLVMFAAALLLVGAGCSGSVTDSKTPVSNETKTPVKPTPVTPEPTTSPTSTPTTTGTKSYTLAQVAAHKDAKSCWTIINTNVYDLTTWVAGHPGGSAAILSICGKNGTSAFEGQHGGSAPQEAKLATFKIGTFQK